MSFNGPPASTSNHQIHSPRPNKLTSARINHSAKLIKQQNESSSSQSLHQNNNNKKRSKTQEDIKSHQQQNNVNTKPSTNNANNNNNNHNIKSAINSKSPLVKPQKSLMSHIITNAKKSVKSPSKSSNIILINTNDYKSPSKSVKQIRSSKSITITAVTTTTTTTSSDEALDILDLIENKNQNNINNDNNNRNQIEEESPSLLLNLSTSHHNKPSIEEKQIEIQNRIHKQRQEMRLIREKNLIEFKNQRLKEELKKRDVESIIESHLNQHIEIPEHLTYQDRCAIKIQSVWRGYLTRKSKKVVLLKYKRLLNRTNGMKEIIRELKQEHKKLIKFNADNVNMIMSLVS